MSKGLFLNILFVFGSFVFNEGKEVATPVCVIAYPLGDGLHLAITIVHPQLALLLQVWCFTLVNKLIVWSLFND